MDPRPESMPEKTTEQTEQMVEKAVTSLDSSERWHKHSARCMRLTRHIIARGEETVLECKQSYLHSLSPARVIATTRRMIIVRPSFWGLYLSHDLFSPTEYYIIPYKQLISVIMSRGRMLSTIHMRIHGFTDTTSSSKDEGEIYGMRTKEALRLANFLEEIIEYRADGTTWEPYGADAQKKNEGANEEVSGVKRIGLDQARRMVLNGDSRFVWLGVEPSDYIAELLNVEKGKVTKVGTAEMTDASAAELARFRNCVLMCYDGVMSGHISSFLKKEHNIDTYVLHGGISEAVHGHFSRRT